MKHILCKIFGHKKEAKRGWRRSRYMCPRCGSFVWSRI